MRDVTQKSTNTAKPNVRNVSHEHTGIVNYGNINVQKADDRSVSYNEERVDTRHVENASIYLIQKFGETKLGIAGWIGIVSGIITILTYVNSGGSQQVFSWLPRLSQSAGLTLVIVGGVLIAIGAYLLGVVKYKYDSQCEKCKEHYTFKETGIPVATETKVKGGVQKTVLRHYLCNKCGYAADRTTTKLIEDEE